MSLSGIAIHRRTLNPSPSFSPPVTLQAWYRAADLSLADNALITSWPDRTGHGNTLNATNVNANFPRLKVGILNGLSVARWGVSGAQSMTSTNPSTTIPDGFVPNADIMVVWVAAWTQTAQGYMIRDFNGVATNGDILTVGVNGSSAGSVDFGRPMAGLISATGSYNDGAFRVFSVKVSGTATSLYVQGALAASGTTALSTFVSAYYSLGDTWTIASGSSGTNFWRGDIPEMFVYSVVTDPERIAAEAYLRATYAI